MKKYIISTILCFLPGILLYASDALFINQNESALFDLIRQVDKDGKITFYYDDFSTPFIANEREEKRTIAKVYVNKAPIYYTIKYLEDFEIEFSEHGNIPIESDYYPGGISPKEALENSAYYLSRAVLSVRYSYQNGTEFGYIYGEAVALEYTDGTISFHIGWTNRVKGPSKTFPEIFLTKETLKDYFTEMSVAETKERLKGNQYDEYSYKENALITLSTALFVCVLFYNVIAFRKNIKEVLTFHGILGAGILLALLITTELKDTLTTQLFGYGFPLFIGVIISVALYVGKYKVEEGEEMFP